MRDLLAVFVFFAFTDTCMHIWLKGAMNKKAEATWGQMFQSLVLSFVLVGTLLISPVLTAILLATAYMLHYANLMHVRFFHQLISYVQLKQFLRSFSTVKQNRTVLGMAAKNLRKRSDIGVLLLWLLDVVYASWLKVPSPRSQTSMLLFMGGGVLFVILQCVRISKLRSMNLSPYRAFDRYGLFVSYLAQIGGKEPEAVATTAEWNNLKTEVMQENKRSRKHPLYGKYKGKNVLFLQLESFQEFLVNSRVKGVEITPFLNQLVKKSIYFDQIFAQYALGHTSDAELVSLNSLYPMQNKVVNYNHYDKSFNALPSLLKEQGYESAVLHGFTGEYYNRNVMMKAYGFDHFFSEEDFQVSEKIGLGFPDQPFLEQAVEKLAGLSQPFFADVITLTSHFPFEMPKRSLPDDPNVAPILNDYFQAVHYTDRALEQFFAQMQERGLLDDTVVVLFGDHEAIPPDHVPDLIDYLQLDPEQVAFHEQDLSKVPMLIFAGEHCVQAPQTISTVGSTLDVLPTVLSLLGMERSEYQFGRNLFVTPDDFTILRKNWEGSFVTDRFLYLADEFGEYRKGVLFDRKTGNVLSFDEDHAIYPLYLQAVQVPRLSDRLICDNLIRRQEQRPMQAEDPLVFALHPAFKACLTSMERGSLLLPYTYLFEEQQRDSRTESGDSYWQRKIWDKFRSESGIELSYFDQLDLQTNDKSVYFRDSYFIPFFLQANYELEVVRGDTLFDFFDEVDPNSLILIAVKDEGSQILHPMLESRLANLGIRRLTKKCFRWSYLNVIWKKDGYRSLYERAADEEIRWSIRAGETLGDLVFPFELMMKSAGSRHGDDAAILIDGKDHALKGRGLNIAVYSLTEKRWVQSICFDTFNTLYSENTVYRAKKSGDQE